MIFKGVGEDRPYPPHGLDDPGDWAHLAPRMIRLDDLVTTRAGLDLGALRAALQGRPAVHGRVLDLDTGAGR